MPGVCLPNTSRVESPNESHFFTRKTLSQEIPAGWLGCYLNTNTTITVPSKAEPCPSMQDITLSMQESQRQTFSTANVSLFHQCFKIAKRANHEPMILCLYLTRNILNGSMTLYRACFKIKP